MHIPSVIESAEQLHSLLPALADLEWLAVDCEFMREDTYYPKLCLIQLAAPTFQTCIDVLRLHDLTAVENALMAPECIKIFHSSSQDLETLRLTFGNTPEPIFDTQIAASLLGYGDQISYANLVEKICSHRLSKSQTRTDWSTRPLSTAQIDYALEDVQHLYQLYKYLRQALQNKNRLAWLTEECSQTVTKSQKNQSGTDWKKIRGASSLQGRARYRFACLADWREHTAQTLNRPKQWVISNRQLLEFAIHANFEALGSWQPHSRLRSHTEQFRSELNQTLLDTQSIKYPSEYDAPPAQFLTAEQSKQVKFLMRIVKSKAEQLDLSSSLLANRRSLERLIQGKSSRVLKGWRKEVIGDQLLNQLQADRTDSEQVKL